MSNLVALRNYIYDLMSGMNESGFLYNANSLYVRLKKCFQENPPVSRTTFYSWFGDPVPASPPSALLLECVPALAQILGVKEHQLYRVAEVLPREIDAALSLSAAAHDFRSAFQLAANALESAGLSSAGEALVVDRILHHKLDYRITVWPVVRGTTRPVHLHSWLVLHPVEPVLSRQRPSTARVESLSLQDRRNYIRTEVITEGLWRSLGLRWRTHLGAEWPYRDPPALVIQFPVEERNRKPLVDNRRPALAPSRILVLSAPFAHGELLVAFLAEALRLGSYDLRYQSFRLDGESDVDKQRFCAEKLQEQLPNYAWAVAENADFLRAIENHIVNSTDRHLLIWLTYGLATRALGSRIWGITLSDMRQAQEAVAGIACRVNAERPVIKVAYDEGDYMVPREGRAKGEVDFNLLTDHVRLTAAEVLNLLFMHCRAPSADHWGNRFDDLRRAGDMRAFIPPRRTKVTWCEPGTLTRRSK